MKSNIQNIFSIFLLLLFLIPNKIDAHEPDQTYLYLRITDSQITGRIETMGRDLNKSLGINLSKEFSRADIEPHLSKIHEYLRSKAQFSANGKEYTIRFVEPEVLPLKETEPFVRHYFELDGVDVIPENLTVNYDPFFDIDPIQRGMVIIEYNWKAGIINNQSLVYDIFTPSKREMVIDLSDSSIWKGFWALIKLGIWHIWIGLDHILFILALILPAVVRRKNDLDGMEVASVSSSYSDQWLPVAKFKPAFWYIIKIITFFTLAHSITLALAALDIVTLPSRFVESVIAFSIALAALHNITPIFKHKEWIIAFGFGLFHGFGFAGVLGEKGLSGDFMVWSLLGFNLGVEIGQVLIICMIFPFLFLLRKKDLYPKILKYGSVLLILISIYWSIERGFEVDLPAGKCFWMVYNSIFG